MALLSEFTRHGRRPNAFAKRRELAPLRAVPIRIDRVAEAAGSDPDVLRLENYDTDIPPHRQAVEATRAAIGRDEANSYLPFSGLDEMKEAVVELIVRRGAPQYDPYGEVVITDGDGSAILNALLVLTDPDDEVVLTDPTYAGMLQRVRLVGAVPKLVPLRGDGSGWRLDLDALTAALSIRTRVLFLMNPAIPSGWVASDRELVNAYREVGAYGRRYGQLTVCSSEHEAAARRRRWRRAAS